MVASDGLFKASFMSMKDELFLKSSQWFPLECSENDYWITHILASLHLRPYFSPSSSSTTRFHRSNDSSNLVGTLVTVPSRKDSSSEAVHPLSDSAVDKGCLRCLWRSLAKPPDPKPDCCVLSVTCPVFSLSTENSMWGLSGESEVELY